ncbi:unnamed protein product [Symbiodinium natans]|uniref:Uncharacterized protein n=1 Tax=Symbiodinium natans TaxID=878477 RepID=A0A812GZJ5_9DINO|nr:unnamed protein product [Symbiodinium natans]
MVPVWFPELQATEGCHWSSRFCELMLRAPLLVCFARSVQRELGLVAAAAALLLDYTISAIALSVISGASIKAFVLSLPLYLVDICRYVDEPGLVVPARRLSNFIGAQRALMLVVTAGLMFWCRKSWEADDRALVTCIAATLGVSTFLTVRPRYVVLFLLQGKLSFESKVNVKQIGVRK